MPCVTPRLVTDMGDTSVSNALPDDDKEAKCHPRLTQYKSCSRSNALNQEERRWQLLQEQKRKRDESFNSNRGLIEQLESLSREQDGMEWSNFKYRPKLEELYRNRLMISEWLENVPEDLAELWYIVPCPVGRRNLVVASGGYTRTYSKHGVYITTFKSALPGGSFEDGKGTTLLDCIWSNVNQTYYVLDVLAWSNQPLLDCETEFRFYWLKTKLEEIPKLTERSRPDSARSYPFASLPYHLCDPSIMTNMMATEQLFGERGPGLDGLLFYHSQTHYTPGRTPLVGWLKPYMVPSKLGIPVAPVYQQEEMETVHKTRRRYKKHGTRGKEMQVDEINVIDSSQEMEASGSVDIESDSKETSIEEEMELKDCSESCEEEMEPPNDDSEEPVG